MASPVLYQDPDATITLLDIPRSLELAQGDTSRKIISAKALEVPFPSVEPKSVKARANFGEVAIQDVLLSRYIQIALHSIKKNYEGDWCLPRITEKHEDVEVGGGKKKSNVFEKHRKSVDACEDDRITCYRPKGIATGNMQFHQNLTPITTYITPKPDELRASLPSNSSAIEGDIIDSLDIFHTTAPKFHLIIMDPPWPNRSARRKQSYGISYSTQDIRALLSSIPLHDHLEEKGVVAVWVTNKPAFRDLLLGQGGLFDEWGVAMVEEWVWVKVATTGEPIYGIDSVWRKPYEILLVGQKKDDGGSQAGDVNRRVLVSVPDLHSRKPNLKTLFEKLIGKKAYLGLEIFARNLTSGWWSWGDEVLKFQSQEHWIDQAPPHSIER